MNIQTEVKNNIIVFYDKSKLKITQKQADYIVNQSCTGLKGCKIDNQYYSFSSMSKVISLEDYYKQYPEQRPVEYKELPNLPVYPKLSDVKEKEKQIMRIKSMMRGLNKYLVENNPPEDAKSRELLTYMKNKLFRVENNELKINNNNQVDRFLKFN